MSDTPQPLTAEQAASYLVGRGHAADASQVLDAARADPGRLSWTADRCSGVAAAGNGSFLGATGPPEQYPHRENQHEPEAG